MHSTVFRVAIMRCWMEWWCYAPNDLVGLTRNCDMRAKYAYRIYNSRLTLSFESILSYSYFNQDKFQPGSRVLSTLPSVPAREWNRAHNWCADDRLYLLTYFDFFISFKVRGRVPHLRVVPVNIFWAELSFYSKLNLLSKKCQCRREA